MTRPAGSFRISAILAAVAVVAVVVIREVALQTSGEQPRQTELVGAEG